MSRIHANNFITTLNGAISDAVTSIVLTSVTGFPSIGAGVTCNVTLANGSDIEIVTATARSSFTLTVTRGAEGTVAKAFASGSTASIRPTADSVDRKSDIDSYTTTATAAGTTTLTVNSTRDQFFTGSTTQTVVMPVVSTLALGRTFHIVNESSGVVTVQSSGANTIQAMNANTILDLECILITGTGTASWYANYRSKDNTTGGGSFTGPGSSTDNAVVRFNGAAGDTVQNSGVIIDDTDNITGVVSLAASSYLRAGGNATAAGYIELLEDSDNGSNKLTITAPASIGSDKTVTLQDVTGTVYVTGGTDVAVADGGTGTSSAGIGAFNNITGYTAAGATGTTSTNLVFSTSPTLVTPTLGVATATSINFGQDALNYYDEDTWTPTFTFATPGDLSVVYGTRVGTYIRIGKIVYYSMDVTFTPTFTTAAGAASFSGLPFTTVTRSAAGIAYHDSDITYGASYTTLFIAAADSSTILELGALGSGQNARALDITNFTSGNAHIIRCSVVVTV